MLSSALRLVSNTFSERTHRIPKDTKALALMSRKMLHCDPETQLHSVLRSELSVQLDLCDTELLKFCQNGVVFQGRSNEHGSSLDLFRSRSTGLYLLWSPGSCSVVVPAIFSGIDPKLEAEVLICKNTEALDLDLF